MRKILFVDDEPLVLQGMQRMFYKMRHNWDMRFVPSGAEALKLMADWPADVVITDMRMPQMNGAQLLNEVMRLYPKTVRLILSGYANNELIMQCVGGTHQFLNKPCDCPMLETTVERALGMSAWLDDGAIQALVAKTAALPSLPSLYFEILKVLESPDATLEDVTHTISKDPGMTAKLLQLSNSAFFGLRRQLVDPGEAVQQLGLETIKSLVLGIHVFSGYQGDKNAGFPIEKVWHHSLAVATAARQIAQSEHQERRIVEESFTAGLLHDVGRLVLAANLPERYAKVFARYMEGGIQLIDAERQEFDGVSHAEVGGYLLGLWGLPITMVEAAVLHHLPAKCASAGFSSVTSVHAANVLAHACYDTDNPGCLMTEIDLDYLKRLGLSNHLDAWREAIQETAEAA